MGIKLEDEEDEGNVHTSSTRGTAKVHPTNANTISNLMSDFKTTCSNTKFVQPRLSCRDFLSYI